MKKVTALILTFTMIAASIISLSGCEETVHLNTGISGVQTSETITEPISESVTEAITEFVTESAPPTYSDSPESDILKDINPSELASIDYTNAKVEYLSGGLILETDGEMPEEDAKKLLDALSAAEIPSTPELIEEPWLYMPVGEDIRRFRITLNTNEKIHIGLDLTKFSDTLIVINNNFYKCDTKSLVKLEKLRKKGALPIIDPDSDPIMNINPSELQSIDFSDAGIYVLWSCYDLTEFLHGLYPNDKELFFQHLKNASISSEIDSSYEWREEDNYNDFRIVLSTGDVIYIGFDASYSNDIFINGVPYKCDSETLENLNSMKE